MIMAIKKLQNNFTTLEQSKRLLELGVPADSADMYYKQYSEAVAWVGEVGDVPQGKTFYMHEPGLRHINPEGTWTWKDGERISSQCGQQLGYVWGGLSERSLFFGGSTAKTAGKGISRAGIYGRITGKTDKYA